MRNKSPLVFRIVCGLMLVVPGAWGYEVFRNSGGHAITWDPGTVTIKVQLGTSPLLSDGSTYNSSALAAFEAWNGLINSIQLAGQISTTAAPSNDSTNEIGFDSTIYGSGFDPNVLAVAVSYYDLTPRADGTSRRTQSDIIFNTAYVWDSYRGATRAAQDLRRVALHELGHVLGLGHPDEADPPQTVVALMNSSVSNLDQLVADDVNGGQSLYGMPSYAPHIGTQPASLTVQAGQAAQFAIFATGAPSPSYQWQLRPVGGNSWADINNVGSYSGATTASLTVTGTALSMSGNQFRCVVTNSKGVSTSGSATLTVWSPTAPTITVHPVNQSITVGSTSAFFISAVGAPAPTFQWQRRPVGGQTWLNVTNGETYSGSTTASLFVSNSQMAMNGDQFRCIALNTLGTATSGAATLTVNGISPAFTVAPSDQAVESGEWTSFNVSVSGIPTPLLKWQRSVIGTGDWTNVDDDASFSGSTTASLVVADVSLAMNGDRFRCIATNSAGMAVSSFSTLYVNVGSAVVDVAAGFRHSVFIRADGSLWAMGDNSAGQLGDGTFLDRATPTKVVANGIVSVAVGSSHSLFIKSDGSLWGMGNNESGQLGDGTTINRAVPVRMSESVIAAEAGLSYTLFIKTDGTLWCTGYNLVDPGSGVTSTLVPRKVASDVAAVAAADSHCMFIKHDRSLWGSGSRQLGKIGDGVYSYESTAAPVWVTNDVVAVDAGFPYTFFVKEGGGLWGVGYNQDGALGPNFGSIYSPVNIASNVRRFSAGGSHLLFTINSNSLWGMGNNSEGQVGDGTVINRVTPVQVAVDATAIAAGVYHSLFTKQDGSLWGMGSSENGQLGNGSNLVSTAPQRIKSGVFPMLAAPLSPQATSGVSSTFVRISWAPVVGAISYEVYRSTDSSAPSAVLIASDVTRPLYYDLTVEAHTIYYYWIKAVNPSFVSSLSLRTSGFRTQIDPPSVINHPDSQSVSTGMKAEFSAAFGGDPVPSLQWQRCASGDSIWHDLLEGVIATGVNSPVLTVTSVTESMSGDRFRCIATNIGGSVTTSSADLIIMVPPGVIGVAVSAQRSFYIRSDGTLWGKGDNSYGELGIGSAPYSSSAYHVASDVVSIAAGEVQTLFIDSAGQLWAMGSNFSGSLGDGTTVQRNSPVRIAEDAVAVSSGVTHSLFLTSDGTLWATGENGYGQLGDGTLTSKMSPVAIAENVVGIAAGGQHSLFIKSDASLWAMGLNDGGQLGDGTMINRAVPVQIASDVITVSAGRYHSMYIKNDGSLWTMGHNEYGQLGDGSTSPRQVAVSVASGVRTIAAGAYQSFFIKKDGTLWSMGLGNLYQLGQGTVLDSNIPVQISTSVTAIAAGFFHAIFVKTDGSLWGFGSNNYLQMPIQTFSVSFPTPTELTDGSVTAPTTPVAVWMSPGAHSDGQKLTWSGVSGASEYEVWRGLTNHFGDSTRIAAGIVNRIYYDWNAGASTYYYWVKAVNIGGTSAPRLARLASSTFPVESGADFNGDGDLDILWRHGATGEVGVWLMNGATVSTYLALGTVSVDYSISGIGDFNGDAKPDILWRHRPTEEVGVWLMNGTVVDKYVVLGISNNGYRICGTGDFNGDGHMDILWRNNQNGEVGVWLMNGTSVNSYLVLGTVNIDYRIAGAGDFNGDGKADVLWRHEPTGEVGTWLMNGTTVSGYVTLGAASSHYRISSTGDYTADGMSDIVWRHDATGEVGLWKMNGTTVDGYLVISKVNNEYQIANNGEPETTGIVPADFNRDGKSDILWRNTETGEVTAWLLNGTRVMGYPSISVSDLDYEIAGTGDFNGDDEVDILWRHGPTGEVGVWLMNGTTVNGYTALGVASAEYTVAGTGDFDLDGETDILWRHSPSGEVGVWLMNGTSIISYAVLGTAGTEYTIAGTGDFNRDGQVDIVWRHAPTGEVGMWLMEGMSVNSYVSISAVDTAYIITGAGDFDGNGSTDILWRHSSTGEVGAWLMDGMNVNSYVFIDSVPTYWAIAN